MSLPETLSFDDLYIYQGNNGVVVSRLVNNSGAEILAVLENIQSDMVTISDFIIGSGEPKNIVGDDTDNVLVGNMGNDTITTGSGEDTVQGQPGDDLIIVDGSGDKVISGGGGEDTLQIALSGYDSLLVLGHLDLVIR